MPSEGVMTCEQASYNPGLKPIKGHEFRPGTQTRSRDKLSGLSLGITRTLPLGPVLVIQPATEPFLVANCSERRIENGGSTRCRDVLDNLSDR